MSLRCMIMLLLGGTAVAGADPISPDQVFSRLDLSREGLAKVKQAADEKDTARAANELLAYYRARKSVKYPIDPEKRIASRGHFASEEDLKAAGDALNHILAPFPALGP